MRIPKFYSIENFKWEFPNFIALTVIEHFQLIDLYIYLNKSILVSSNLDKLFPWIPRCKHVVHLLYVSGPFLYVWKVIKRISLTTSGTSPLYFFNYNKTENWLELKLGVNLGIVTGHGRHTDVVNGSQPSSFEN